MRSIIRMKLLKLQLHPWFFHFLGNPISCLHLQQQHHHGKPRRRRRRRTIKLVKSDGVVKIYDRKIHVSELMMEFPKHLVCRSDSFYIGQKIPALSENEKLQFGHCYFLLPNHCFQTVLSFVTIASLASSRNPFLKKAAASAASSCQPFDIQRSPSGCSRIRVSDEFISKLMMIRDDDDDDDEEHEDVMMSVSKVCTTPELHKDYRQLVGLRRWKPKLETVKEKEKRRISSSSFGIGRRRKNKLSSMKNHKSSTAPPTPDHHHHHHFVNFNATSSSSSSSSSLSSNSKSSKIIKIKARK